MARIDDHLRGDAAARARRRYRQGGPQRRGAGGQRCDGYPCHRRCAWWWLSYELQRPCGFLYRAESYSSASCAVHAALLVLSFPSALYRVVVACGQRAAAAPKVKAKSASCDRAQRAFSGGRRPLAAVLPQWEPRFALRACGYAVGKDKRRGEVAPAYVRFQACTAALGCHLSTSCRCYLDFLKLGACYCKSICTEQA